jgi:hypothetical protein
MDSVSINGTAQRRYLEIWTWYGRVILCNTWNVSLRDDRMDELFTRPLLARQIILRTPLGLNELIIVLSLENEVGLLKYYIKTLVE